MLWAMLVALGAWGLILQLLDRPAVSLWKLRTAYRAIVLVFLLLIVVLGSKAMAYRAELRGMIATHYH